MSSLEDIRRQYFSLVPPRLIELPSASELIEPTTQAHLIASLLDECRFPQPEDTYRRGFWRNVLRRMEDGINGRASISELNQDEEVEIDERLYELLSSLMIVQPNTSSESMTESSQSHRTFIYNLPSSSHSNSLQDVGQTEKYITLLEEQSVLQGGTTGLRTWTAALRLGQFILHHPKLFLVNDDSQRFLELGAGTGFLSCLLSQQGHDVCSTDLADVGGGISPLDRLKHNVALNHLEGQIQVKELDWMDSLKDQKDRPDIWSDLIRDPPSTIIAADIIYDPDLITPLVATLTLLLGSSSSSTSNMSTHRQAIIAATVRNPTTLELFVKSCDNAQLEVLDIDLPETDTKNPTFWDSGLDISVPVRIMRILARTNT